MQLGVWVVKWSIGGLTVRDFKRKSDESRYDDGCNEVTDIITNTMFDHHEGIE